MENVNPIPTSGNNRKKGRPSRRLLLVYCIISYLLAAALACPGVALSVFWGNFLTPWSYFRKFPTGIYGYFSDGYASGHLMLYGGYALYAVLFAIVLWSRRRLLLGAFFVCLLLNVGGCHLQHAAFWSYQTARPAPYQPSPSELAERANCEKLTTEELVERLREVEHPGVGYHPTAIFTSFIVLDADPHFSSGIFGSQAPVVPPPLRELVRRGVAALPVLLTHLGDSRPIKMPSVSAMMWSEFGHEYDYNPRIQEPLPKALSHACDHGEPAFRSSEVDNAESAMGSFSHRLTVGDLCFVAIGQIVNRNFHAVRYQPSGGLIINSPTRCDCLQEVVRRDYADLTEQKHRELLTQDMLLADHEARGVGAYERLSYFYPESVESVVLQYFALPRYDYGTARALVQNLYAEKDGAQRMQAFQAYVQEHGEAARQGLAQLLFRDLNTQEKYEQWSIHLPLREKEDARGLLIELYGYPDTVKSTDRPLVGVISMGELESILEGMTLDKSKKVDEAVYDLFKKNSDDIDFAVACFERLAGRGYDDEIREYCKRRMWASGPRLNAELRGVLRRLDAEGN